MTNIIQVENKMATIETETKGIVDTHILGTVCEHLYNGVTAIIDNAKSQVAIYVNAHASMTFWSVGKYIIDDMDYRTYSAYGKKILATLSQSLTSRYGKGYTYSALTRMMKVARVYSEREMFAMLSQTLSWSHFLELVTIKDPIKRLFYQQMGLVEHWSVQQLRDKQNEMTYERSLIAAKPDDEIVEALVAIDIKIGKFKPQDKGQMELYLKYLQKHDMQPGDNPPIGLLLCGEGNTEHIELLMLDEDRIKVAQYLTILPDKQWFLDKLNRSIMIAKEYGERKIRKDSF